MKWKSVVSANCQRASSSAVEATGSRWDAHLVTEAGGDRDQVAVEAVSRHGCLLSLLGASTGTLGLPEPAGIVRTG